MEEVGQAAPQISNSLSENIDDVLPAFALWESNDLIMHSASNQFVKIFFISM